MSPRAPLLLWHVAGRALLCLLLLMCLCVAAADVPPSSSPRPIDLGLGCVLIRENDMLSANDLVGVFLGRSEYGSFREASGALPKTFSMTAKLNSEGFVLCEGSSSEPLLLATASATSSMALPGSHLQRAYYTGVAPALTAAATEVLTTGGAEVVVEVTYLTDTAINVTACEADALVGWCNFRSAVVYCQTLLNAESDRCTVSLPAGETIYMDPALNGLHLSVEKGTLRLEGRGSVLTTLPGDMPHYMFSLYRTGALAVDFEMSNMVVRGFGADGGLDANFRLDGMARVLIEDVSFIDNHASGGGAIYFEGCGSVNITRCNFMNNSATGDGGDLHFENYNEAVTVSHCNFSNSYSTAAGGAISVFYRNNDFTISDCMFIDTFAEAFGGAVYVDYFNENLLVTDSQFLRTRVVTNGGAIYISTYNRNAVIQRSFFDRTEAIEFDGGAIYVFTDNEDLLIADCVFHKTISDYAGGAIYLNSNNFAATIRNSTFSYTASLLGAGAIDLFSSNHLLTILACTFLHTQSILGGGAISLGSDNNGAHIKDCFFNSSFSWAAGGGIRVDAENRVGLVEGCTFYHCEVGAFGGGLFLNSQNQEWIVRTSSFIFCQADSGGAIYFNNGNRYHIFSDVFFQNNTAASNGGAVAIEHSNIGGTISNCTFDSNRAGTYGAGLALINGNVDYNIENCVFYNNSASAGGGALHSSLQNSQITVRYCSFLSNSALDGGGVYFGDFHNQIRVLSSEISNSLAAFGAGVYVTQFNTDVLFLDTTITGNVAAKSGGGLYVFATDIKLEGCEISRNRAYQGGGVFSTSTTVTVLRSSILNNRGDRTSGLLCQSFSHVYINASIISGNHAGSGAAMLFTEGEEISLFDNVIVENRNDGDDGGAVLLVSCSAQVTGNNFTRNSVNAEGGAMHMRSVVNGNIRGNIFDGNTARNGAASALYLSSSAATVHDNWFTNNTAARGGGTVFWQFSSMSEPVNLSKTNTFSSSNTALYGRSVATEATALRLDEKNMYTVTDYDAFTPQVVLYAVDYYDQIVASESSALAMLSSTAECYKSTGYVTGRFVEQFDNGVANFTSLQAFCDPGYDMVVDVTSAVKTSVLRQTFELSFRSCVTGEYFGDSICTFCEEGTYSVVDPASVDLGSLSQQQVCRSCPSGSVSCSGASIRLDPGYWRISESSTSTIHCPYQNSCRGGTGTGNELCADGYGGPVCAVCQSGYAFRRATQQCEPCSESSGLDAVTILIIILIAMVGVCIAVIVYKPSIKEKVKNIDSLYVFMFGKLGLLRSQDGCGIISVDSVASLSQLEEARKIRRRFQARLKIYITLWQIISLLPFTLDLSFPDVYELIVAVLGVFNLGISVSSLVTCSGEASYDAIDNLVVSTLYPIVVTMLLACLRKIHLYKSGDTDPDKSARISARYFSIFLLFTYLILPFTSVAIFQTFSCQDVDQDDAEDGRDIYMTIDYSVSCTSSKYQFGVAWAIASIFVYPVGVPLFYLYVLHMARDDIVSRDDMCELGNKKLTAIRLLYEFYHPHMWYWEVVETAYRLLLTGVLVVISQGSGVQIIVGIVVALFFLKLTDVYRPYADTKVQTLREIGHWQVFFIFFLALLLKSDFSSVERAGLDACLVLAATANIVLDLLHTLWYYRGWCGQVGVEEETGSQRRSGGAAVTMSPMSKFKAGDDL